MSAAATSCTAQPAADSSWSMAARAPCSAVGMALTPASWPSNRRRERAARSVGVGAGMRALAASGTSRQPPPSGCLVVLRRTQGRVERACGDEGDILPQRCREGATGAAFRFPKLRIHNAATASPCPLSPSPSPTRVEGSRRRGERGLSIWADTGSSACKWLRICCLRI
jgi:hypothetical protein